jgi:hypothetical protein
MEMTPAEIWYLFEAAPRVGARQRLELIEDMTAVAAPSQFKEGGKYQDQHVKALRAAMGLEARYTSDKTEAP